MNPDSLILTREEADALVAFYEEGNPTCADAAGRVMARLIEFAEPEGC